MLNDRRRKVRNYSKRSKTNNLSIQQVQKSVQTNISAASFKLSHTIAYHGKPLSFDIYLKENSIKFSEVLLKTF